MKKLLIITAFMFLLCPVPAFAETAESKSSLLNIKEALWVRLFNISFSPSGL